MIRRSMGVALALLCAAGATAAEAKRTTPIYSSLTVFGDSLLDGGNGWEIGHFPAGYAGYQNHRWTNGYTYADDLSLALFGAVTTGSLQGGTNYAVTGQRVTAAPQAAWTGVDQLARYSATLAASGTAADPDGLYILGFGANDAGLTSLGRLNGYPTAEAYLRAAAHDYAGMVTNLQTLGARNFLISDAPYLFLNTPYVATFNSYFDQEMAKVTVLPDTTVYRFNYNEIWDEIIAAPATYGLPALNTTIDCKAAKALATNCDGYFSFDGTHPTAQVYQATFQALDRRFGLTAVQQPQPVPEPAEWALMICGSVLIGLATRKRRQISFTRVEAGLKARAA